MVITMVDSGMGPEPDDGQRGQQSGNRYMVLETGNGRSVTLGTGDGRMGCLSNSFQVLNLMGEYICQQECTGE